MASLPTDADAERSRKILASIADLGRRTHELASRARHAQAGVSHLALALIEQPDVQRAIRVVTGNLDDIAELARGMIDDEPHRPWWQQETYASTEVRALFQRALDGAVFGGFAPRLALRARTSPSRALRAVRAPTSSASLPSSSS
jgi:hypothetical protein